MKSFNDVLEHLSNEEIGDNKKVKYIKRNKKHIINLLEQLNKKNMVNYLLDSSIPICVKKMISSYIDNLEPWERIWFDEIFENIKSFKEEDLYKEYYPYSLKRTIVKKMYRDKYNVLCDKNFPFYIKKILIDSFDSSKEFIKVLKLNPSIEITDYIISKQLNYSILTDILLSRGIDSNVKNRIIDERINEENIFLVLSSLDKKDSLVDEILTSKKTLVDAYIKNLSGIDAMYALDNNDIPNAIKEEIKIKKSLLMNIEILFMIPRDLYHVFSSIRNSYTTNKIMKYRSFSIKLSILNDKTNIVYILNKKNLPSDIEKFIWEHKTKTIDDIIQNMSYSEIFSLLSDEKNNLPNEIQEKIIKLNKNKVISSCGKVLFKFLKDEFDRIAMELKTVKNNRLRQFLIEEKINKDNIMEILNHCWYRTDLLNQILEIKKEILDEIVIDVIKKGDLALSKISLMPEIKSALIEKEKHIIIGEIEKLSIEEKHKYLNSRISNELKCLILSSLGVASEEMEYYISLINNFTSRDVLTYFESLKDVFVKLNIDFDSFIQYGVGSAKYSKWFEELISIIKNDYVEDLSNVKEYLFNSFYDKDKINDNKVYEISSLLETIDLFYKNKNLLLNIASSNTALTDEDKENILSFSKIKELETLEELSTYRRRLYNLYLNEISVVNIRELKKILNAIALSDAEKTLRYIGGSTGIKMLQKTNEKSKSIKNLTDELLMYARVIEMVDTTNNEEGLRTLLHQMLSNPNDLIQIKNAFRCFNEKVRTLFEMDSVQNLTRLSDAREKEGVLRDDLGEEFGTGVYDFSDKNYVLYGHVVSDSENIESLVEGRASSNRNFISLTPISYKGQKFYWDKNKSIIAYDEVKKESFICSSISNMATNGKIRTNSSEVINIQRHQRGILETSSAYDANSETLLYREGLKPCGIILPGGRVPTDVEKSWHDTYNLPYIITQEPEHSIENPKKIFELTDNYIYEGDKNIINNIINILDEKAKLIKENDIYTGREIAIFTDAHALYEPTFAILEDIKKRDIDAIYSLGDNIGFGPSPKEVVDLLDEYNVISISGNSEYYSTLGIGPFLSYFDTEKQENQIYTDEELGSSRIERLRLYPASLDIVLGNKTIALAHFANDVRWDYDVHSTWTYQTFNEDRAKQFLYTNSFDAKKRIEQSLNSGRSIDELNGYISAKNEPIFGGKRVVEYDSIIQGHVHFQMHDKLDDTEILTLRGVAMGFKNEPSGCACYYILKEKKEGSYDVEKVLVPFNENSLISTINSSGLPSKSKILKYINA